MRDLSDELHTAGGLFTEIEKQYPGRRRRIGLEVDELVWEQLASQLYQAVAYECPPSELVRRPWGLA